MMEKERPIRDLPILIFDFDGTLHETMYIYKPAIEKVVAFLREECGYPVEMPSDRRISSWLGMNVADMWQDFMPELPMETKKKAGKMVGAFMHKAMENHQGKLYPGVEELLDKLSAAGYTMAILSNCGTSHAERQWKEYRLFRWFTAFFDCETYGNIPKSEIMTSVAADFRAALEKASVKQEDAEDWQKRTDQDSRFIVIGDRYSDFAAGMAVGMPTIACRYGYGTEEEAQTATLQVNHPEEIYSAIESLF